jgi:type II secretory pathway pseudopilin PulG
MAVLTDEIKTFIVKSLACYDSPSQVAKDVLTMFGVEVSRQQVYAYNPDGTETPAQRWVDLFDATRDVFLADVSHIGVTHKAVRLRMLERMIHKAIEHNYTLVAAKLLAQVARECGGMYERPASRAEKAAAEAREAAAAMEAIRAWADQPPATTLTPDSTQTESAAPVAPADAAGRADRPPQPDEPADAPADAPAESPPESSADSPTAPPSEAERLAQLVRTLDALEQRGIHAGGDTRDAGVTVEIAAPPALNTPVLTQPVLTPPVLTTRGDPDKGPWLRPRVAQQRAAAQQPARPNPAGGAAPSRATPYGW